MVSFVFIEHNKHDLNIYDNQYFRVILTRGLGQSGQIINTIKFINMVSFLDVKYVKQKKLNNVE